MLFLLCDKCLRQVKNYHLRILTKSNLLSTSLYNFLFPQLNLLPNFLFCAMLFPILLFLDLHFHHKIL